MIEPPAPLGMEAAGVVVDSNAPGFIPGDRVAYACSPPGAYATMRTLPAAQLVLLPDHVSEETAAALMLKGMTAEYLLHRSHRVRPGDTVLVHAAAGGVGMAAIQLCRIAGAEVIGTASAGKHATLRDAGVAHAIDYRTQDFEHEVKRITGGRGVDIVLDATGAFGKSYRALAPLGRLVCFGLSGAATGLVPSRLAALGRIIRLPWFHPIKLMNDNKAVIGVNLGHLWDRIELLRGEMLALLTDYEAGRIAPVVGKTFPLVDAAAAHRFIQERQNVGKVLLTAA
jgi:NADPH:quinone reductase-like Zn-dependent oxidoreductase